MSVVCHILFLMHVLRIRIELFKHIIQTRWMLNLVNLPIIIFTGALLHPFDGYTPCSITFLGELMNALTSLFIFIVRSLALAQGPQLAWQRSHGSRWGAANGWSVGIRYISLWESNLVCWTCLYGTYPTISSPHYIMLQEKGLGYKTGELGAKAWFFDFRQERADQALHSWAYWQFKYNHDAWRLKITKG